jgi:Fe2+ or Zn2+ uptake regulation protein
MSNVLQFKPKKPVEEESVVVDVLQCQLCGSTTFFLVKNSFHHIACRDCNNIVDVFWNKNE